jgi:hypothetical protein
MRWRDLLAQTAMRFVWVAAFPRLAYRLRWPTRLGPRGLIAYVTFNALSVFLLRQLVLRCIEIERTMQHLREQLGREPTELELIDHYTAGS